MAFSEEDQRRKNNVLTPGFGGSIPGCFRPVSSLKSDAFLGFLNYQGRKHHARQ